MIFVQQSSVLSYVFNPPLYLEEGVDVEMDLVNFDSFKSIPSVDDESNRYLWLYDSGLIHCCILNKYSLTWDETWNTEIR